MKKRMLFMLILFFVASSLASCYYENNINDDIETEDKIVEKPNHNDFSKMNNREMEAAVNYQMYYKPSDGYVGDIMPYYENGTYYLFFLKDQGTSYNHSIFLVETTDFLHYEEKGEILRSSSDLNAQDNWIGTGSVCKVDNTYYFFYTGHNDRLSLHERIMVAKSENDLYHFKKISNFYIDPTSDFNQVDFRDPDVTYDSTSDNFILTITTQTKKGRAVIAKYIVKKDLSRYNFDSIIYTDTEGFWNLECTDTFKIDGYWYLSFSGQDDTLWFAKSRSQYVGYGSQVYGAATRIEGKYFYAPKAVSNGIDTFFVGWARRRGSCRDSGNGSWAGNIVVSKIVQKSDGSIYLAKLDNLGEYYRYNQELENTMVQIQNNNVYDFSKQYESFMLEGDFSYSKNNSFGFILGLGGTESDYGHIIISPNENKVLYSVANKSKVDAEVAIDLKENETYHFTLVFEGSVVVLYIDNYTCLTTRYYGKLATNFGFFTNGSNVTFSNLNLKIRS